MLESVTGWCRRRLFGISARETSFSYRGFASADPRTVARLEHVGGVFVRGYMLALDCPDPARLRRRLDELERESRGFAFEGAAMALALLDRITPWNRGRLRTFLAGEGSAHSYMVIIGAGWAWARLGSRISARLAELDPVLCWLALDGYGFHEGYFHPERTVRGGVRPRGLCEFGERAFDAGVGRSLWFVCAGEPKRIAETIATFSAERHAELWAGVGLAASYAGGVCEAVLSELLELGERHRDAIAQGSVFAAKARSRAANSAAHTDLAVSLFCSGTTAEDAALLCDTALECVLADPRSGDQPPILARWQACIREEVRANRAAMGDRSEQALGIG